MSLVSRNSSDSVDDVNSIDSLSSLRDEEVAKVTELRKHLGTDLLKETPLYDDNYSLLRWINGWDSKWSEILLRFRYASEILKCMGVNELEFETPDEVNEYVSSLYPASEYFVGGLMGYDHDGNIIVMQSIGQIYPKMLVHCGRVSDVFRLSIIEATLTIKLIKRQETRYSKRLGIVVVLDLNGLCMDHIYPQTLKIYANLLRILQDMFPDVAKKIFIINAPSLFASAYSLIKPAIAERTRQRVRVLGTNYSQELCKELGTENVYSHWGGTKVAKRGRSETGTLRMGGKPPDSLRYLPANNSLHIDDAALTKLNVPARSRRFIEINCRQEGQMLRWFFNSSADIDFSVYFGTDETESELVVPKFRLHTDFVPEYNAVRCTRIGTYRLCFDNSFSTFFSKDVQFHVHCVDENHNDEMTDFVEKLNA